MESWGGAPIAAAQYQQARRKESRRVRCKAAPLRDVLYLYKESLE